MDVALRPGQPPGSFLIWTTPRHSQGWLLTKPFADQYSPESMPAVATKFANAHWNCWMAAASSVCMSAGLSSASIGTLAGFSTSSSRSHAAVVAVRATTTVAVRRRRVTVTVRRADVLAMMSRIVRSRSEGETERGGEARRRGHDGLESVGELAVGADFRIPHVRVGDRNLDQAVARRSPTILRGPQHPEVATGDAHHRARCPDAPDERRLHRVGRGDLAEPQESGAVRARRVRFDCAIDGEQRIPLDDAECRALVVERANFGVGLVVAAVAVDAGIKPQAVHDGHRRVVAHLPDRLRVAPVHARRLGARNVRPALLDAALPASTVADRRAEIGGAGRREHRLAHLVHEEVRDAEADAVLCLAAAAD